MRTIKLGSWGGTEGIAWDYIPSTKSYISEIIIDHGDIVDAVSFQSVDRETKKIKLSGTFGGGGGNSEKILIDGSNEYLISIKGTTKEYFGRGVVIQSLIFCTNVQEYGPYGARKGTDKLGTAFAIPLENGEVVGFYGRASECINAIGVHVIPSEF